MLVLSNPTGGASLEPGYTRARVEILNDEAHLDGLSVEGAPGAGGPWAKLDLGAFAAETTAYAVTVRHGTTHARLVPATADEDLTLRAGSGTALTRVRSGESGPAVALAVGANVLVVKTTAGTGVEKTYEVTVTREAAAQQQQVQQPEAQQQRALDPLTARLRGTVSEHDGETPFMLELVLSESLDSGSRWPSAASFKVKGGSVESVRRFRPYLYQVHVAPKSWKDVTVTLAGGRACGEAGAVCTADGRSVSNTSSVTVGGPVRIRIAGARAKEGKDASLDFAVTLNRTASHQVSVDYATEDGTAAAGADYTATSGTLTFAAGETAKTVSVPVLDDAIDEGKETMRLLLSNPRGAYLRGIHSKAKGVIRNDDPLQAMWLSRFGRTVASDAVASVTARLETLRDAGSHVTLAGQRVNLGQPGDGGPGSGSEAGRAFAETLTGLARAFGAREARVPDGDDPFARHGLTHGWDDPVMAPARRMTGRELLLGSSFRAVLGGGAGSQWTSWGQGGVGVAVLGGGAGTRPEWRVGDRLDGHGLRAGPSARRVRDDAQHRRGHGRGRGLALRAGEHRDDGDALCASRAHRPPLGVGARWDGRRAPHPRPRRRGGAALPHGPVDDARRGGGAGRPADPHGGGRLRAGAQGGRVLGTHGVRPGHRRPSSGASRARRGESSRVRAVLDGSHTFALARGAAFTPSVELGVRHDGGDAETGTGVEFGAGLGYADPSRGLDMALKVHGLAVHAQDGYDEWGVSGQLRLVPGGTGRGLSMSLTPSWGVDPSGSERLWAEPASAGLAANGDAVPSSRLDGEVGYGMALLGNRFTGTPNVGFGFSDTAREVRMGWRLTSAVPGDPGFEVNLDATRREAANDNGEAEHGVMLRSLIRW